MRGRVYDPAPQEETVMDTIELAIPGIGIATMTTQQFALLLKMKGAPESAPKKPAPEKPFAAERGLPKKKSAKKLDPRRSTSLSHGSIKESWDELTLRAQRCALYLTGAFMARDADVVTSDMVLNLLTAFGKEYGSQDARKTLARHGFTLMECVEPSQVGGPWHYTVHTKGIALAFQTIYGITVEAFLEWLKTTEMFVNVDGLALS